MLRRTSNERRSSISASSFMSISRGKKIWSEEEDELLKQLVEEHGTGNWTLIAQSMSGRTGKQCRERFHNHLDVGIKKGDWTEEEDRIILVLQREIGNQWAKITKLLPGRTDNAVKNRFHATERAKSRGKLNEAYLSDPVFKERILREAMRVNGELGDDCTLQSGETDLLSVSEASAVPAQSLPLFPVAAVHFPDQPKSTFNSIQQAAPVVPCSSDDESDDAMSEEEHSVHSLMEMEIISFEDELEEMEEHSDAERESPTNAPFEIDPGCFNFDFAFNNNASPSPSAAAHAPTKMRNLCGLESWGATSALHAKAPAAVPVSGEHEQFIPQLSKQPSSGTKPHNAWPFASHPSPSQSAVPSLSKQASKQEQAYIQKQQQNNNNFPPLTFTAFGSVTTFLCSR